MGPAGMRGAVAPWFEAAAPGLLTARAARNFLGAYPAGDWPEVVKLLALLGIAAVRGAQAGTGEVPGASAAPVGLPELRAMAAEAGRTGILRRAAQGELAGRLEELRQDLAEAAADAEAPPAAVPGVPEGDPLARKQRQRAAERGAADVAEARANAGTRAAAAAAQPRPRQGKKAIGPRVDSGKTVPGGLRKKPSAAWRRGYPPAEAWTVPADGSGVGSGRPVGDTLGGAAAGMGPAVHPPWWFREGNGAQQPARKKKARAEPRLAYSRVLAEERGGRVGTGDLVTAKYLPVPSSGYGKSAKPAGSVAQAVRAGIEYAKRPEADSPVVGTMGSASARALETEGAGSSGRGASTKGGTAGPASTEGRGAIAVADAFLRDPWMHHFSGGRLGSEDDVALARLGRDYPGPVQHLPTEAVAGGAAAPSQPVPGPEPLRPEVRDGVAAGAIADLAAPSAEELGSITKHTDQVLSLKEKKELYGNWVGDFKDAKPMTWKPKWSGVDEAPASTASDIAQPAAAMAAADLSHPALSAQQRTLAGWGPSSRREDLKWDFEQIFQSEAEAGA